MDSVDVKVSVQDSRYNYTLTIGPVINQFVICESFSSQFMYGHFFSEATNEILQEIVLPVAIRIEITSPFDEQDTDGQTKQNKFAKTFIVYSAVDHFVAASGVRTVKYLFCSPEMMISVSKNICKGWDDKTMSEIIEDIVKSHMKYENQQSIPEIEKDNSEGSVKFLATKQPIIEVINNIRELAVDSDGYPFVFFENKKGFNFKSIKKMLENVDNIPKLSLSHNLEGETALPTQTQIHILKIDQSFDLYNAINQGGLCGTVYPIDIYNRKSTEWKNDEEQFTINKELFTSVNSHPIFEQETIDSFISSQNSNEAETYGPKIFLPVTDGSYMDTLKDKLFKKQAAEFFLSSSCLIEAAQFRSTSIFELGTCCDVSFERNTEHTEQEDIRVNDKSLLNGRFLITKIMHTIIGKDSTPAVYNQTLQLCKFGYEEEIEQAQEPQQQQQQEQ